MPVTLFSVIGALCLAIGVVIACRPVHGMHERQRGDDMEWLPATLAPLPAPARLSAPRACPDVPRPAAQLSVAPSAAQVKYRRMTDSLIAMSWQSHLTLQRTYDMMAFATVVVAIQHIEAIHA